MDSIFQLPVERRRNAFVEAGARLGLSRTGVEKDLWVCWMSGGGRGLRETLQWDGNRVGSHFSPREMSKGTRASGIYSLPPTRSACAPREENGSIEPAWPPPRSS
jgi:hypothetical protein